MIEIDLEMGLAPNSKPEGGKNEWVLKGIPSSPEETVGVEKHQSGLRVWQNSQVALKLGVLPQRLIQVKASLDLFEPQSLVTEKEQSVGGLKMNFVNEIGQ